MEKNSRKAGKQKVDVGMIKWLSQSKAYYFILLFVGFLLLFHYIFEPKLYYQQFQTLFLCDQDFFYSFSAYPGGITEWAALFLFQFFYFNWAGSIILAACLVLIHVMLYLICKKVVSSEAALLSSSLPVVLLFGLQLHYNFPFFIISRLLFLVVLFYIFTRVNHRIKIIFIFLFPLTYYLLGGWFYLLFTILTIINELQSRKKRSKYIFVGSYLAIYLLMPYLAARYWFIITMNDAYLYLLPYAYYFEPISFEPSTLFYLFNVLLVFLLYIGYVYNHFLHSKLQAIIQAFPPVLITMLHLSVTLLLIYLLYGLNFDPISKSKLKIVCYAEQEQWKEVIREAQKITEYDRMVNFHVNRSFSHTGVLLDTLFSYRQKLGIDGLFLSKVIASQIAIPTSDLYFDLGHINASRVFAYEGLTKYRYHPKIMQRLVLTNLIQYNLAAAHIFNNLLKESLVYRKWALEYEKYLQNPDLIQQIPLVTGKRALTPKEDFFIQAKFPTLDLDHLVQTNKRNKMAVDYLFACYLLSGSLKHLYNNLHLLKEVGYIKLPRHIEEAVLVHILVEKMEPVAVIRKYNIDKNTVQDFIEFNKIQTLYRNDKIKAQEQAEAKYGSTFWYYMRFTHPKMTGLTVKSQVKDVDMYKLY